MTAARIAGAVAVFKEGVNIGLECPFLGKFSAISYFLSQPSISLADLRSQVMVKEKTSVISQLLV